MGVELKVFAAQFAMIMLLGLQSLNVNGRHYAMAAITSALLGLVGWYITATIAVVGINGIGSSVWWSFLVAGPCGIMTAIYVHPFMKRVFR